MVHFKETKSRPQAQESETASNTYVMAELSTPPPIGIDLGTTHSRIGVWRNEWVEIIPNQQGIKTTPSYVAFTDTRRYIGEAAEHQATTNPCNTIFDMKRLIGKRFSSSNVKNDMELLPFKVVIGPGDRPMISVQYQGEEKKFSAMEISSMVLRKLCDIAEAFLRCPIKNAVIAVPACFNNSQRLGTVQAGSIAGLNVMRIINEPTAAAITYGLDNIETNYDGKKKKKKNVLIFDLGGGTLDVSILTMERENYKVKATVGDPHLGGVDFDNQLIKHCIEEIKKELEEKGLNLDLNPKTLGKLRTSCERTKRILSSVLETHIEIDSLLPDFDFYSCITRARFEELNNDLFERCIDIVEKCLIDAKMYRSSIHDVVVIGGSTRIPKVQEMLRDFFNGKELSMRINSDEAVACGATIQATILSGLNDKVPDLVVQDILTHSLGIDIATDHVFMIPRNTPIPTTEEVILSADQIELPIKVYEGEMTKIQNNDLLGEMTLNNAIYFAPYGLLGRIVVCFNVDENGIFTTSVVDKMVGQREIHMIQITSDFMSRMSRKEIEKMAADAEKLKLEEDKYKRKLETKNALETWLNYLSKSIMNDNMINKLAPACKKKINDVIGKTMQWLEKNPQAVGDEFDEQYREYMNCLDKTLAQAGILNFQRSPPYGGGTMTNSKTNYNTQVRQGHTTNIAGARIYTKSEASNTTRHAVMPIFKYYGFIGDKFCSSDKQGVKTSRADS